VALFISDAIDPASRYQLPRREHRGHLCSVKWRNPAAGETTSHSTKPIRILARIDHTRFMSGSRRFQKAESIDGV